MREVMGIVFSNMHEHMVSDLTTHRCMGSIPVGGRYRLIDFVLSGFAHCGIKHVGVITKTNYQSLMDHLSNGREWDLSRKNGGLVILPPFGEGNTGMYRGRIEALHGIMGYIQSIPAPYIVTADCDIMANIDFTDFVQHHIDSGADITVMYKRMDISNRSTQNTSVFEVNDSGRVRGMRINPPVSGEQNVYMNVMMISKTLLESLVSDCYSRNVFSFDKGILQGGLDRYHIQGYEFNGYVGRFDSLKTYYSTNMEMLDAGVRRELFPQERPVYTKIRDEAPVRYGLNSRVYHSLVADGCLIEGDVENSVLFRGVTVGKGARVKNSIIMQGSVVGENASLDCVIADKNVQINEGRMIMGFKTYPVYISKGSVV